MASVRHLSKPPIQEAVIDFVFSGSQMERDGLDSLASTFPEELWQRQTITTTTVQAQIGGAEGTLKPKATSAFEGFSMRALDGSRIVQIREDRLTISHVARYERWEDRVDDAAARWEDRRVGNEGGRTGPAEEAADQ